MIWLLSIQLSVRRRQTRVMRFAARQLRRGSYGWDFCAPGFLAVVFCARLGFARSTVRCPRFASTRRMRRGAGGLGGQSHDRPGRPSGGLLGGGGCRTGIVRIVPREPLRDGRGNFFRFLDPRPRTRLTWRRALHQTGQDTAGNLAIYHSPISASPTNVRHGRSRKRRRLAREMREAEVFSPKSIQDAPYQRPPAAAVEDDEPASPPSGPAFHRRLPRPPSRTRTRRCRAKPSRATAGSWSSARSACAGSGPCPARLGPRSRRRRARGAGGGVPGRRRGSGRVTVADGDDVEVGNLARQVVYGACVGRGKAESFGRVHDEVCFPLVIDTVGTVVICAADGGQAEPAGQVRRACRARHPRHRAVPVRGARRRARLHRRAVDAIHALGRGRRVRAAARQRGRAPPRRAAARAEPAAGRRAVLPVRVPAAAAPGRGRGGAADVR